MHATREAHFGNIVIIWAISGSIASILAAFLPNWDCAAGKGVCRRSKPLLPGLQITDQFVTNNQARCSLVSSVLIGQFCVT